MLYKDLIELFLKIKSTSSRNEKISIIADFLKNIKDDEAVIIIRFLTTSIFPKYEDRKLDVGWSLIKHSLKSSEIKPLIQTKPLSLKEVYEVLEKISSVTGPNSRRIKEKMLTGLFSRMSEIEKEYLIRILFGELRIGASEGLVLEAVANALGCSDNQVRRALMFLGDLGDVYLMGRKERCGSLEKTGVVLFRPVRPMLAEMGTNVKEVLAEMGGKAGIEYKYDGIRIQIHRNGEKIRIYTRRLSDITSNLPDIVDKVRAKVRAKSFVIEGEVFGMRNGKPVAFQVTVRRVRRQENLHAFIRKIPLIVKFFDIIYLNGETLVDMPYSERWKLLEKILPPDMLAERIVANSWEEAERFYEKALREGHEGVMVKSLFSPYVPGTRGRFWLKVKKARTIDAVVIAAEWGHGRRQGWLSDYLLAVFDESKGVFTPVGKTFKGLTDEEFKEMTRRLLELEIRREGHVVFVRPEIVVEVAYSDIQKSPKYPSGMALRFARIVRIRYDKSPYDITTLDELKREFEKYFNEIK